MIRLGRVALFSGNEEDDDIAGNRGPRQPASDPGVSEQCLRTNQVSPAAPVQKRPIAACTLTWHVELNVAHRVLRLRTSTLARDSSCYEDLSPQRHGRMAWMDKDGLLERPWPHDAPLLQLWPCLPKSWAIESIS
jgi:hypothetical protein